MVITAPGCAPRVTSVIIQKLPVLSEKASIVLLNPEDSFGDTQSKIGILKVTRTGMGYSCSYNFIRNLLQDEANKNGANIVKIIGGKKPGDRGTCKGLKADLYRVDDLRKYENQIEWSENRRLQWEDFKGSPPVDNAGKAAITYAGFGYYSTRVHIFSKPVIHVTNIFDCHKSWVRINQKRRPELLEHEQLHFDIAEVYARRLRKAFSSARINYFNLHKKTAYVFQQVYKDYMVRQEQFEEETEYSLNIKKQEEWVKQVSEELKALQVFSK